MTERLAARDNPSLFLLNYDVERHAVSNLIVVPRQFFTLDLIEQRKPLAPTARRAGWIGCNILINRIPRVGRIPLIVDGSLKAREAVVTQWQRTCFLNGKSDNARGWLMDVMACIETLGRPEFTIDDAYGFAPRLQKLYPNNNHVREKIRQQLQVLRDNGWLEFVSRGRYRLTR